MGTSPLSSENVSSLIDHVLKSKDPATVGLRKILKKKEDESRDFPFHAPLLKEFESHNSSVKSLSEEDTLILELEKKVHDLQVQLNKHQDDAINAEKAAYEKGHNDGLNEGIKKGSTDTATEYEKRINDLQLYIHDFLQKIETEKREIFSNAENVLLKLCFEIVKKILSCEIKENHEIILSVIKKALSYIGDRERIVIRVASSDFETVSNRKDFWTNVSERLQDILIEKDDRIEQGGCIIESNSGLVDARLGVQIEELSNLIEKIWENSRTSD